MQLGVHSLAAWSNDMDASRHMATSTITELDLSAACHPNSIADRINAVPGLKTSTGEFG